MESVYNRKIIQNFKGEIGGTIVNNQSVYDSMVFILENIEDKFGNSYNKEFIEDLYSSIETIRLKYDSFSFDNLENDIFYSIQEANKFEDIKLNYCDNNRYFEKLNMKLENQEYSIDREKKMENEKVVLTIGNFVNNSYKGIETYENPSSGLRRIEFSNDLLEKIKYFHEDILKKDFNPKKDIRGFRAGKENNFSFEAGGGYDITDTDLLGGRGTGKRRHVFESYLDYIKEPTHDNLEILNKQIETHNNSKFSDGNYSENIKIEKFEGYYFGQLEEREDWTRNEANLWLDNDRESYDFKEKTFNEIFEKNGYLTDKAIEKKLDNVIETGIKGYNKQFPDSQLIITEKIEKDLLGDLKAEFKDNFGIELNKSVSKDKGKER